MFKTTKTLSLVLLMTFMAAMLAACRRATPASPINSTQTDPASNKIEAALCPFVTGSRIKVTCGTLAVPEDYKNPQDAQIRLFVATIHSTGDNPPKDPVIVMYQDPGAPLVENMARYAAFDPFWSQILKEHDLVIYDLRGVGLSEPDTGCPEVAPAQLTILGKKLNREARSKAYADVVLACRDKLIQAGIHLENYTTEQNVADLNSVVIALEAKQVNLLALGYGAYLSMRMMQENPDRIRSALLSSPYNGQILAYDAATRLKNTLTQVFESCKANEQCNAAYPSLEQDFYAAVAKLNQNPAEITLNGTFLNGQEFPVALTGDMFLDLTFSMISRPQVVDFPSLVYDINLNHAYQLSQSLQDYLGFLGYTSPGLEMTVYCQAYLEDQANTPPQEQVNQALRDWQAAGQQTDEQICSNWFSGKTDLSENPDLPSSVPALVIYGEWNTYAPPDWVEANLKSFSKAKLVKFPNTGWLYWYNGCSTQLATAFLNDPTAQLDTSCAATTPEVNFTLPAK